MSTQYRADIDGLRAVAVAFVVLYHAGYEWASGGYIGVDVFFVISGYLITGILIKQLSKGSFSLSEFYKRRIARIIPALSVVIVTSFFVGYHLLLPEDLIKFSEEVKASSLFYANIHFMGKSGYFDSPEESNHLLHMWSLAVEEQFYIFVPIALLLLWRIHRPLVPWIVFAALLASFAYAELFLLAGQDKQAFFNPLSRSWELLAGSALALLHFKRSPYHSLLFSNFLSLFGLLFLLYAFATYSDTTRFPGAYSLLPVIGTVLLIHTAGKGSNIVGEALAWKPVRGLGLISYSLYLWHWPIFSFYKYYNIEQINELERAVLIITSIVAAYMTWAFVENRARFIGYRLPSQKVFTAGFATLLTFTMLSIFVEQRDGIVERFSDKVIAIASARNDAPSFAECGIIRVEGTGLKECVINEQSESEPQFLFWGDSHAEAMLPAVQQAAQQVRMSGIAITRAGCPAIIGVNQEREGFRECSEKAEAVLQYLEDSPSIRHVILASRWALYVSGERYMSEPGAPVRLTSPYASAETSNSNEALFYEGLDRTFHELSSLGLKITFVEQVPETEFDVPRALAMSSYLRKEIKIAPAANDYAIRQAPVRRSLDLLGDKHAGVEIAKPSEAMCDDEACQIAMGGMPLYRDTNHLTVQGALTLAPFFTAILR